MLDNDNWLFVTGYFSLKHWIPITTANKRRYITTNIAYKFNVVDTTSIYYYALSQQIICNKCSSTHKRMSNANTHKHHNNHGKTDAMTNGTTENINETFFFMKKETEEQILREGKICDSLKWTMMNERVMSLWYHFAIECLKISDAFFIEAEKIM